MGDIILGGITAHQVDLVFHQGDQGAHNDGHPFGYDGRQLVTEAFAPSGGHDYKGVIARQQVLDNGQLVIFKRVKTKVFLELP